MVVRLAGFRPPDPRLFRANLLVVSRDACPYVRHDDRGCYCSSPRTPAAGDPYGVPVVAKSMSSAPGFALAAVTAALSEPGPSVQEVGHRERTGQAAVFGICPDRLKEGDLSLTEFAACAGFSAQSQFSYYFNRLVGVAGWTARNRSRRRGSACWGTPAKISIASRPRRTSMNSGRSLLATPTKPFRRSHRDSYRAKPSGLFAPCKRHTQN